MPGKALSAALAHYKELGTRFVDVPEWPIDGRPLRIFYQPLTIAAREAILAKDTSDVAIVIAMAKDEQGQPIFTLEDEQPLRRDASFHVVNRVASILFALPKITDEDTRKN